eukprot:15332732-Alexandrium_andersonii.AAC.1
MSEESRTRAFPLAVASARARTRLALIEHDAMPYPGSGAKLDLGILACECVEVRKRSCVVARVCVQVCVCVLL